MAPDPHLITPSAFSSDVDLTEDPLNVPHRQNALLDALSRRLGCSLDLVLPAAPFVLIGCVDGRRFYLRERHGRWRLVVAPASSPLSCPWFAPRGLVTFAIAEGVAEEVLSLEDAAVLATRLTREFLTISECTHVFDENPVCCTHCGIEQSRAHAFRV